MSDTPEAPRHVRTAPKRTVAKATPTKSVGAAVYINVSDKSPEDRASRARVRVDNLERKIERLTNRPFAGHSAQAKIDAQASLNAWRKVLATAEFEINYTDGEAS